MQESMTNSALEEGEGEPPPPPSEEQEDEEEAPRKTWRMSVGKRISGRERTEAKAQTEEWHGAS